MNKETKVWWHGIKNVLDDNDTAEYIFFCVGDGWFKHQILTLNGFI